LPSHSERGRFGSEVHTCRIGRAIVVSASGELDSRARRELGGALVESATGDDDPVLVDLTDASVVDSTVIGVLLNALRRLTRQDRHLSVVIPPGPLRRSFELARLVDTFSIHPTLHAALAEAEAHQ
jgi:anti-anti-sigma factor